MRSLTKKQIEKLTNMPEWMLDADGKILPRFQGRVFASNEGWMYRPTKIHPEYPNKQMPAYCISAIPELAKYMEATPSDGTASDRRELFPAVLKATSMTYTRRSANRYMIDISLDEEVYATPGTDVQIELALSSVTGDQSPTAASRVYTLAQSRSGETNSRTGVIRFDLRFTTSPNTLAISSSPGLTITAGALQNVDDNNTVSSIDSSGIADPMTILS